MMEKTGCSEMFSLHPWVSAISLPFREKIVPGLFAAHHICSGYRSHLDDGIHLITGL